MSEKVRGLMLAHGDLSAGLVDAVREIAGGDADVIQPLSNRARGPEALLETIQRDAGAGPLLIFTDLASGSCAFAARKLATQRPDTAIICGANLAVLLDFVFHADLPLAELVERLVSQGRGAIIGSCAGTGTHATGAAARR